MLDGLEARIDISNQNLKASAAAFREAEFIVAEARAGFFPTGTVDASGTRSKSGGGGSNGSGSVSAGGGAGNITDFFSTSVAASWTPDFWGQVRRTVEANVATAQASAADLANARLSAQGTLAGDYLQLRVADELKRLLDRAAQAFAESLRITRNQYRSGTTDQSAVAQAEAQLLSTQAQAIAVGVMRAQFEHAIAVLIGVPPAELTIAPTDFVDAVPDIPAGLPSALLERRPDIAAAERDDESGQRRDRGRGRSVLSDHHAVRRCRCGGAHLGQAAHPIEPVLVVRGERWRKPCSTPGCAAPGSRRRSRCSTRISPITGRPC